MTNSQDLPRADQPAAPAQPAVPAQPAAPRQHRSGRRTKLAQALAHRLLSKARPRRRFEFPQEGGEPAVVRNTSVPPATADGTPDATADGAPDAAVNGAHDGAPVSGQVRTIRSPGPQHPIHFGFMATVGVGLALLVFFIITNVGQLLVWIGAALFIALGLDPVVRWLEKRSVPRPVGIVVALALLAALVAAFFATVIPTIVNQTSQFFANAPGYAQDFLNSEFFQTVDRQFQIRDRVTEEVDKFFANSEALGGIFGGVLGVGTVIVNGLFGTLIVLVLTLYFLASLPVMKSWAYRLAPHSRRHRVEVLSEEITRSVGNYVIGQACVAILNAAFALVVMTIAHVPFSALLTFVVALLAFIPLIGGLIAAVLVTVVALTAGWQTAALFAVPYVAYLQFEAYFVSPRIMHKAVAVPGAVAVIAVIAGGTLLGVLGALIAIPTAAAVMLLLREIFIARQDRL